MGAWVPATSVVVGASVVETTVVVGTCVVDVTVVGACVFGDWVAEITVVVGACVVDEEVSGSSGEDSRPESRTSIEAGSEITLEGDVSALATSSTDRVPTATTNSTDRSRATVPAAAISNRLDLIHVRSALGAGML